MESRIETRTCHTASHLPPVALSRTVCTNHGPMPHVPRFIATRVILEP